MSRRRKQPPRAWQPMQPAEPVPVTPQEHGATVRGIMDVFGLDREAAEQAANETREETRRAAWWMNDRYVAIAAEMPSGGIHLSIRRRDRGAAHDWRDFQRIKNDVLGPEAEAVELYPAESRLIDTANQYHLWALPPGERFPIGFHGERATASSAPAGSKARQRSMT